MNSEEWYKAAQNRYTCSYFKQDVVPERELIEKIINESLRHTPVFSCIWHHEVEIYGPEYYEEKKKLAIQGVENVSMRQMFDTRNDGINGIDMLKDYLEDFCDYVEDGSARAWGNAGQYNENNKNTFVPFNTQLMAPYLLAFKVKPDNFGKKDSACTTKNPETKEGIREKSVQSAMAQAYALSVIATHYGVDVGFCGCFIYSDENVNEIWHNDFDLIKFVGLGYAHEQCYEHPDSKHGKLKNAKMRPAFGDICTWK